MDQQLCVRRVASIGLPRDALERGAIVLDVHQLARALIPLLPMAVSTPKLGSRRNRATPKTIASIPCQNHLLSEHNKNIALDGQNRKRQSFKGRADVMSSLRIASRAQQQKRPWSG